MLGQSPASIVANLIDEISLLSTGKSELRLRFVPGWKS
jgi:hypothetical protein